MMCEFWAVAVLFWPDVDALFGAVSQAVQACLADVGDVDQGLSLCNPGAAEIFQIIPGYLPFDPA